MQIGSDEHKAQFYKDLVKTYQENIWKEEMHLVQVEELKADKLKQIAEFELRLKEIIEKIERKEYASKGDGKKLQFVAEREIEHVKQDVAKVEKEIADTNERKDVLWPAQIAFVKEQAKNAGFDVE